MHEVSDVNAICAQFEQACSDFQAPATRAAAEAILSSFRQIPKVLPLCQYILERSTTPMMQFQIALAIGDIAVRDYTLYALSDMLQLKNFMIEYCLKNTMMMKYARDQLLSSTALIAKRSFFDISDQDKEGMYLSIKQLITMDDHSAVIATAYASALVDQFSSSKASTIGLSWELHHKSKMFFESHILFPLLEQSVTRLLGFTSQTQPLTAPFPPLLTELIALIERILQWDFAETAKQPLPGSFAKQATGDSGFNKDDELGTLKKAYTTFPQRWHAFIFNPDVLWLFFMIYSLVVTDQVLSHQCRQCLVQLAGFTDKTVGNDPNAPKVYATTMMQGLLRMMDDIYSNGASPETLPDQGPHVLCVIQMIRRLFENISVQSLLTVSEFFKFLDAFGKLTLTCLRGTVSDVDDGWISEAADECLQTWVILANVIQPADKKQLDPTAGLSQDIENLAQFVRNVSLQIMETFIDTQLERSKNALMCEDDDEDINGGFKDWDIFADRLSCIGILGRLDPQKSLQYLEQLLSDRFNRQAVYFTTRSADSDQYLLVLHEHVHWILLILTHVLADAANNNPPRIPDTLMHLSASQPFENDQIVNISQKMLEVFRFFSSFGANTVEASNCSPRVAETLIWSMEKWSKTYLLVNENDYGYISSNITRAFGPSHGQGLQIVDFFIDQIKANFALWNADPDVLLQMTHWLNTCGTVNTLRNGFLQSSKFPDLVQFVTTNLEQLPEVIHNSLIQTVATIASGSNDIQIRNNYLELIFGMIQKHFGTVLQHPEFMKQYQRMDMMNSVLDGLEMFDGLALACQNNNTQTIFGFVSQFFESFIELMNLYKSVIEVQLLILQLMTDLTRCLDFSALGSNEKHTLFQAVIGVIRAYGAHNQGKKRRHNQEEQADRPYPDIVTVLTLLTNVMTSEFEDFNITENVTSTPPGTADVADVVLFGVNVIIPMIDLEMLKIPTLCQQYIKLISHLIEFFPDKLVGLPSDLFNNLMTSLEFGVSHDIVDVSILALQAVAPLAFWAHNQKHNNNLDFLTPWLNRFLEQLGQILLFQNLDSSMIDAASEAFLMLICAQKDTYIQVVNRIISQQRSDIQQRLLHAFEQLETVTPKEMRGVLPPSQLVTTFKEALKVFLMDVRAVLRIK